MSSSAQLTLEQLKVIIEDEKDTDTGAREVQEEVEDGEEVLDPENTSSELNTVLSAINNQFQHECLDQAVRLLNFHPICESTDNGVPAHKYSISGLPGTKFLAHQVCAIWFIVRRWVWDSDMRGALRADEMGHRQDIHLRGSSNNMYTADWDSCNGVTTVDLVGNTLDEWVNMAQNYCPGIISEKWEWYGFRRQKSVPRRLSEIMTTPPQ